MKRYILTSLAAALCACLSTAQATGKPPAPTPAVQTTASSVSSSDAHANALGYGVASTSTGGVYVLPAAGQAAALPANLCPDNHSSAWGIGWNFFWTSSSDVGTSMTCLEQFLSIERERVRIAALAYRLPYTKEVPPPRKPAKAKPCPQGQVLTCKRA